MDISGYYTRMRTLWDELKDFQSVFVCTCGSMKEWMNYQNQDCVLEFLMGLNDSYAQIRAQILMMDPLPVMSKIFSLVIQEERQRSIHKDAYGGSGFANPQSSMQNQSFAATFVKDLHMVKEIKMINQWCDLTAITQDTQLTSVINSMGIHLVIPSTKKTQNEDRNRVNQVKASTSVSTDAVPVCHSSDKGSNGLGDSLSPEHCKQLIAFLSSQLQLGYGSNSVAQQHEPSVSCFSDTQREQDDWDG
ncbi:uncharacterized protein [Primulina eburnea]|uniref:uncharacterized protein n=1 Tax=Primulina eburnea TaxID=1245227 RepID=UPI003C6CB492